MSRLSTRINVVATQLVCLGLAFCLSGCGFFSSGTWEDDPGNWKRAFRSRKPDDVVVVHSKYWRSPHWTYEFEYFFQIEHNDKVKKQLFEQNEVVRLQGEEAEEAKKHFFDEPPKWFAPKAIQEYEVWVFRDEPDRNFKVFVDKKTGCLFLTDYSV